MTTARHRARVGVTIALAAAAGLFGLTGVDTANAATQSFSTTVVDTTRGVRCPAKNIDTTSRSIPVRVLAPDTGGPHPVIVLAHGFGQTNDNLADSLGPMYAERGYVVVAPRFPLSSGGPNFDFACAATDLRNQAKDVSFVLTELVARRQGFEQLPEGRVDADRMGHYGVSGGGITGLLFFNSCCTDPRIKAVAAMIAYPPLAIPSAWSWDSVNIPLLMVNAKDDPVIPYGEARQGWEAAQPPKFFVTVPGGNPHGTAPNAQSPKAIADAREAFLDRYVKADVAAGPTLVHAFDGVDPAAAAFEWALPIDGPPTSTRLAGADRIGTALAASADAFGNGTAGTAVIARSTDYPDALSGAPLAAAGSGPLLLTPTGALDDRVRSELERVLPKGRTVHLLGGTNALSPAVADAVTAMGYTVARHAGASRYETAVAVASALGDPDIVLLATGRNFPDALAAGAAAAESGAAILLTEGPSMPAATSAYLASANPTTRYAIGGPAAAAEPGATAITGADRYETAAAVARRFFTGPAAIGAATGENFPDALGAGAHLAAKGGPLVLVQRATLPAATRAYLAENRSTTTAQYVYGGPSAVTESVRAMVHNAVAVE